MVMMRDVEKKMQLVEVAHLEFVLETSLQLVDYIHITCQNDHVDHMNDHNHNVLASFQKIQ